jgi:Papain family cysteine protease
MPRALLLLAVSVLGLIFTGSTRTHAQTGSITPTATQLQTLPVEPTSQIELIEEPVIDLRQFMPPVGRQMMNDCTAWAAAYAKSYAEAREHGWTPDSPGRIFSPTFLYNQVNSQKDKGSSILDVVKLMQSKGAATLSVAPYLPNDFLTQPTAVVFQFAQAFPIADAYRITQGTGIRRALQRREVVVIGVHVGPLFMSGNFPVYTRDLFNRDDALRQPDQPHGKHAMIVVGYDDRRKAFLLQNSWGTRWAQQGFCYVSYDLFDVIKPSSAADKSDGLFCNWALVMNDVQEPVEFAPDGTPTVKAAGVNQLKPTGFADLVGFDAQTKTFLYTFRASLQGPRSAVEQVASVEWAWTDASGKPKKRISTDQSRRFLILDSTSTSPTKVTGTVKLKSGDSYNIQGELPGQNPKAQFRVATPTVSDHYWGRCNDGTPLFQVGVGLDVPLTDDQQVSKIVYSSPGNAPVEMPYRPRESRDYLFNNVHTYYTTGEFPVSLSVHYKDGGVKQITHSATPTDDIFDGHRLQFDKKLLSTTPDGRNVYAVTLKYDRPRKDDYKIYRVDYYVGPQFSTPTIPCVDTFGDYAVYLTTDRDFRVKMTAFEDFQGVKKEHVVEQWVELDPKTAYDNPHRVALVASDSYLGQSGGWPYLRTRFEIKGDYQTLGKIKSVTYTPPPDVAKLWHRDSIQIDRGQSDTFFLDIDKTSKEPIQVSAVVELEDGSRVPFKLTHTPTSSTNDFRTLTYLADKPDPRLNLNTPEQFYRRRVRLSSSDLDNWAMTKLRIRGVVNGVLLDEELDYSRWAGPRDLAFAFKPEKPTNVEVIVDDITGYQERLSTTITPDVTTIDRPAIGLRVLEKVWNADADGPMWIALFGLSGDDRELAAVKQVAFDVRNITDDKPWHTVTLDKDITQQQSVLSRGPAVITARLTLADGSTSQFRETIRCESNPSTDLSIAIRELVNPPQGDTVTFREVSYQLAGHEELLRKIKSVTYKFDDGFEHTESTRQTLFGPDFMLNLRNVPAAGVAAKSLQAVVTLDDGSTRTLSSSARLPDRPAKARIKTQADINGNNVVQLSLDAWPYLYMGVLEENIFNVDHLNPELRWVFWPSHVSTLKTNWTKINISRIFSTWGAVQLSQEPNQAVELLKSTSNDLSLRVEKHPMYSNYFVAGIDGPVSKRIAMKRVTYSYTNTVGTEVSVPVESRWGLTSDTFEHRLWTGTKPKVKAVVELESGETFTLE